MESPVLLQTFRRLNYCICHTCFDEVSG